MYCRGSSVELSCQLLGGDVNVPIWHSRHFMGMACFGLVSGEGLVRDQSSEEMPKELAMRQSYQRSSLFQKTASAK